MAWFLFQFPAWFQAYPSSAAAEAQASCQSSAGFFFFFFIGLIGLTEGTEGEGRALRLDITHRSRAARR